MKTFIISLSILILAGLLFLNLRGMGSKDVPEKVKAAFAKLYPDVKDVEWHTENGNYEGRFNYNSKDMSVQINDNGDLVQRETYLTTSELPQNVQSYLSSNYSGTKLNETSEVTDANNIKSYQVETKDKVLYFDNDGNFLKAENNHEGEDKDDDDDD